MIIALPKKQPKHVDRSISDYIVLNASAIEKSFGGNRVLDGVDLSLRRGECVLLAGENGSGKTTLINILTGNLEPDAGRINYCLNGKPVAFEFPRPWWKEVNPWSQFRPEYVAHAGIGRSWQDIRLFGSLSLENNLAIAMASPKDENPLRAFWPLRRVPSKQSGLLGELGLAGREHSSADKVSLGQAKRTAIARAVAAGAKVLFLDEPLSGLDRQGIDDVVEFLQRLIERHSITLVIVEHVFNQPHILPLITTRWTMSNGKCVAEYCDDSSPVNDSGPNESHKEPWLDDLCAGAVVLEEPLPRNATLTRIRFPTFNADRPPVLSITDLVVKLGNRPVLGIGDNGEQRPFDLTIHQSEIVVLHAPNGWGKTTLFNAIAGAIRPLGGTICIDGNCGNRRPTRNEASLVPAGSGLFPGLQLTEAASVAQTTLPSCLRRFGNRDCASLSGGERQRAALALANPSPLNAFDEPLSGLDDWREFVFSCRELIEDDRAALVLVPQRHQH